MCLHLLASNAATATNAECGAQEVAPFRYHHLGNFAFVGADNAVLEMPLTQDKPSAFTGFVTGGIPNNHLIPMLISSYP